MEQSDIDEPRQYLIQLFSIREKTYLSKQVEALNMLSNDVNVAALVRGQRGWQGPAHESDAKLLNGRDQPISELNMFLAMASNLP